jgi:cell division protein FtsI (penicillin-binding protein 3)
VTQPRGTRPGQPGSTGKTGSAGGSRTRASGPRTAPRRAAAGASGSAAHPKAHGKASQPTSAQSRKPQASGSQPRGQRNATAAGPARSAKSPRPPQKRAAPPRRPAGHRPRSVQVGTASPRRRMRMMVVAVLFVFSIFGAQLLRLPGFDASATSQDALSSRMATVAIPAMRGSILDSKGTVLASSIERRTVTVDQTAVVEYKKTVDGVYTRVGVAGAAEALSPLVGMPVEELTPILTGSARYRVVQKNITPLNWRKIAALGIPGIYSEPTSERNYPTSTAAASLVGFLQSDGSAGSGVEVMMDKALAGKAGKTTYEQALDGRIIPTGHQQTTPAVPGKDVKLTINSDLQWFAQNALAQKVIQTQALSGTVVVQHARTGELLAVASYPTFDPNTPGQSQGNWTNKAFNEVYEPGSTAKIMTSAAALEEGVVTPSTIVEVPNRIWRADGREFKDSHDHPTEYLTFAGVLAQSSNIGTVLAGEKIKSSKIHDYFYRFGLGQTSGMAFPGEGKGILKPAKDWDGSQRVTVLYGQGLSVNALQATGVFQTIANDGVRVPPRIISAVGDGKGAFTEAEKAKPIRVVSPKVARQVRDMMEGVVGKEGTAPEAKIEGYRVAGKTGTADRYDSKVGGYSGKTASFIGFAPADDPQLVVSVTLQRPIKGYFGGVVAGPVFRDVMTYALQELEIPPTNTTPPKVTVKADSKPSAGDTSVLRDTKSDDIRRR